MSRDVGSITGDCESCQNEISALTIHVTGVDFTAHANHPPDTVQDHPHLHSLFMQKSFIYSSKTWTGVFICMIY